MRTRRKKKKNRSNIAEKALTNKFNETHKPLMKGVKFDERENVEIMCRTEIEENKLIATVLQIFTDLAGCSY